MKQILIKVDESLHKELKLKVVENNTSIKQVLEDAIKEYLKKDD